jgi:hypothetical protein
VWGSGRDDVWAVSETFQGFRGTIIHWNGAFWSALDRTPRAILTGVFALGPNDAWAVGPAATVMRYEPLAH